MPDDVSPAPNRNGAAAHHHAPRTRRRTSRSPSPRPRRTARTPALCDPAPGRADAVPRVRRACRVPLPTGSPVPGPARLRVVVADDNPVVRAGLGVLLSGRADIQVVAEAADGREAYEMTLHHRPDVVLLDVRMPGVDGISALPHLVGIAPVLMLTYSRESEIVHEALRLGAGGYLVHGEFTADQLVRAVRDTKDGRANFTATAADALLAHMRLGSAPPRGPCPRARIGADDSARTRAPGATPPRNFGKSFATATFCGTVFCVRGSVPTPNRQQYKLSSREVEVMDLIASGMSNQQIAATCFISEKTVKNHINRIFTKLHSATRSEAIAHWLGTAPRHPGRQP